MKKPQYKTKVWYETSEAVELLATERKILEFLHKDSEHHFDDVRPITQVTLFELRKRIQEKKGWLTDVRWASEND